MVTSFSLPTRTKGHWYPVTSTINWCEEDYYASIYFAEVVNAFTNLLFLCLGIRGLQNCRKYGHDTIYSVSFIGYIFVGIGSFLFHSTLKYPMQLVDELSMIYTTCIMCYACFSFGMLKRFSWILAASLVALSASITDPSFHQIAYAILTAIVLLRSIYVMEINIRPSFHAYDRINADLWIRIPWLKVDDAKIASRDMRILRDMWWIVSVGLSVFLAGFGIWTLDNKYCSVLRRWRHELGLPWGIILEGHGWRHLMTGTGAYFYLVWGIWLRHCLNGRQEEYELSWPSIFSMPDIVARQAQYQADNETNFENLKTAAKAEHIEKSGVEVRESTSECTID